MSWKSEIGSDLMGKVDKKKDQRMKEKAIPWGAWRGSYAGSLSYVCTARDLQTELPLLTGAALAAPRLVEVTRPRLRNPGIDRARWCSSCTHGYWKVKELFSSWMKIKQYKISMNDAVITVIFIGISSSSLFHLKSFTLIWFRLNFIGISYLYFCFSVSVFLLVFSCFSVKLLI